VACFGNFCSPFVHVEHHDILDNVALSFCMRDRRKVLEEIHTILHSQDPSHRMAHELDFKAEGDLVLISCTICDEGNSTYCRRTEAEWMNPF
jgi:hypothetical protein